MATQFSFYLSKAFGGGHTNVVEVARADSNYVLVGTDVSGIFISSDGGKSFLPRNFYVNASGLVDYRCVAAIAINPDWVNYPGHMYALVGEGTANSGNLMFSTDYGMTWNKSVTTPAANNTPVGHGNNTGDQLPAPQPRSTGSLIQVDTTNGYLYCASYQWGMYRVLLSGLASGTTTWDRVGFTTGYGGGFPATNYFIRSVMLGAGDPDVLYVATHTGNSGGSGHVWRCTNPRAAAASLTWEEFTDASGVNMEELTVGQTTLFGLMSTPGNRVRKLASAKTAALSTAWVDIEPMGPGVPVAPTAPTLTASATAGNPNGTYLGAVSFLDANGKEMGIGLTGTASPASKKIDWTNIPTGPAGTTARKLYRTIAGGGAKGQTDFFVVSEATASLADNVTTSFAGDNASDATLQGRANPVSALHSLDGFRSGGVFHLAISTIDQDNKAPIWLAESSDTFATTGTATWKNVTTNPDTMTHNDLNGPNVPEIPFAGWVFTPTTNGVNKYMFRNQGPGGRPWFDRNNLASVWTGGRVFHTTQADLAAASQNWYPYLNGIVQFAGRGIAADPNTSVRFYEAVLDSGHIRYTDRGATPVQDKPPGLLSGAGDGISVCCSQIANPTTIYVAFGDANNNNHSEIWRCLDPWGAHTWELVKDNSTSMGGVSDNVVTGMVEVQIAGTRYLLAYVRGSGIWKTTYNATAATMNAGWTKMTSTAPTSGGAAEDLGGSNTTSGNGSNQTIFSTNTNSSFVYAHVRGSGVWRVNGIAGTWTRIYRNNATGNAGEGSGFVQVRPGDDTKTYVSRTGSLIVRLDLSSTCAEDAATVVNVYTGGVVGAFVIRADKKMYCWSRLTSPSVFLESDCTTPGTTDTTWTDVSSDLTRNCVFMPYNISAAPDGSIYTSLRGNNMIVAQMPSVHVSSNLPNPDFNTGIGIFIA